MWSDDFFDGFLTESVCDFYGLPFEIGGTSNATYYYSELWELWNDNSYFYLLAWVFDNCDFCFVFSAGFSDVGFIFYWALLTFYST